MPFLIHASAMNDYHSTLPAEAAMIEPDVTDQDYLNAPSSFTSKACRRTKSALWYPEKDIAGVGRRGG